jgi:hypothetical protein
MQIVSEKLSTHVIHNYDKFVAGVGEVRRTACPALGDPQQAPK